MKASISWNKIKDDSMKPPVVKAALKNPELDLRLQRGKLDSLTMDVVLSTLNCENKLVDCIESVLREVPVNKIIVVDGGSTDGTLEIIKKYPQVDLYIRPDLNLGQSRAFSFEKVTTEWFVQVDSDIVLRPGWFQAMLLDQDKGDIIEGGRINHSQTPDPDPAQGYVGMKKYQSRAYFSNNLIRTKAVEGLKLDCLHLEDELTRRYIEQRGFKWYKNCRLLADHYSNPIRYKGVKRPVVYMAYPDWVYTEKGQVDALSGITWAGAIKKICLTTLNRFYTALKVFGNPPRENLVYLRGYIKGRQGKKTPTSPNQNNSALDNP
jgi:glycosyltransferase involved in cell wall biosynthesis